MAVAALTEAWKQVIPSLLTVREIRDLLGCSRSTVYRWIDRGLIERVGRLQAPEEYNFQRVILIHVRDQEIRQRIADAVRDQALDGEAPLFLSQRLAAALLASVPEPSEDDGDDFGGGHASLVEDFSALVSRLCEESSARESLLADFEEAARRAFRDPNLESERSRLEDVLKSLQEVRTRELEVMAEVTAELATAQDSAADADNNDVVDLHDDEDVHASSLSQEEDSRDEAMLAALPVDEAAQKDEASQEDQAVQADEATLVDEDESSVEASLPIEEITDPREDEELLREERFADLETQFEELGSFPEDVLVSQLLGFEAEGEAESHEVPPTESPIDAPSEGGTVGEGIAEDVADPEATHEDADAFEKMLDASADFDGLLERAASIDAEELASEEIGIVEASTAEVASVDPTAADVEPEQSEREHAEPEHAEPDAIADEAGDAEALVLGLDEEQEGPLNLVEILEDEEFEILVEEDLADPPAPASSESAEDGEAFDSSKTEAQAIEDESSDQLDADEAEVTTEECRTSEAAAFVDEDPSDSLVDLLDDEALEIVSDETASELVREGEPASSSLLDEAAALESKGEALGTWLADDGSEDPGEELELDAESDVALEEDLPVETEAAQDDAALDDAAPGLWLDDASSEQAETDDVASDENADEALTDVALDEDSPLDPDAALDDSSLDDAAHDDAAHDDAAQNDAALEDAAPGLWLDDDSSEQAETDDVASDENADEALTDVALDEDSPLDPDTAPDDAAQNDNAQDDAAPGLWLDDDSSEQAEADDVKSDDDDAAPGLWLDDDSPEQAEADDDASEDNADEALTDVDLDEDSPLDPDAALDDSSLNDAAQDDAAPGLWLDDDSSEQAEAEDVASDENADEALTDVALEEDSPLETETAQGDAAPGLWLDDEDGEPENDVEAVNEDTTDEALAEEAAADDAGLWPDDGADESSGKSEAKDDSSAGASTGLWPDEIEQASGGEADVGDEGLLMQDDEDGDEGLLMQDDGDAEEGLLMQDDGDAEEGLLMQDDGDADQGLLMQDDGDAEEGLLMQDDEDASAVVSDDVEASAAKTSVSSSGPSDAAFESLSADIRSLAEPIGRIADTSADIASRLDKAEGGSSEKAIGEIGAQIAKIASYNVDEAPARRRTNTLCIGALSLMIASWVTGLLLIGQHNVMTAASVLGANILACVGIFVGAKGDSSAQNGEPAKAASAAPADASDEKALDGSEDASEDESNDAA